MMSLHFSDFRHDPGAKFMCIAKALRTEQTTLWNWCTFVVAAQVVLRSGVTLGEAGQRTPLSLDTLWKPVANRAAWCFVNDCTLLSPTGKNMGCWRHKQKLSFNRALSRICSKGCKTPPGPSPSSLRHKDNLQQHNLLRKETGFPPGLLQCFSEFVLWCQDVREKVKEGEMPYIILLSIHSLIKCLYSWNSFFLACSSLALMYTCTVLENQNKQHLSIDQQGLQQDYLSNSPALNLSKQRWQAWRPDQESWRADSCSVCLYDAWCEAWVLQVSISHTACIALVSQYVLQA